MKSWYRTIREDELKDGSIRKVYHLVFETDDKSIVEKIEQFFYDVMDAKTEPTISKMEQVDKDINVRSKTEPSNSENPNNCKKCKWWNESYGCHWKEGVCHYVPKAIIPKQCVSCDSASRIIEAYSRGFEDGAEAAKTIKVKALHKDYIEPYVTIEDEPKTQMETQNSNLTFEKRTMRDCYNCKRYETEGECIECHYEPKDECAKEYEELGLKELKELIEADRKTENSSEKPNNCEHITEDGVTCAKYPACDYCLDNPLNKVKGSERLLKGKTEPTISKMEQVDKDINVRSKDCETCLYAGECDWEPWQECPYEPKTEPQTDCAWK